MIVNTSSLLQFFVTGIILVIVSIIFSIFSPFGIGFIIFSIIRGKTESSSLKKVSFIFQIILAVMALLAGIAISLMFSIGNSGLYMYGTGVAITLPIILGVSFVFIVEVMIIIWQSVRERKISPYLRINK